MQVGTRTDNQVLICPQGILTHHSALSLDQILVEGGGHHGLRVIKCHGGQRVLIIGADIGRLLRLGRLPVVGITGHLVIGKACRSVVGHHIAHLDGEDAVQVLVLILQSKAGLVQRHGIHQVIIGILYAVLRDGFIKTHSDEVLNLKARLDIPCKIHIFGGIVGIELV